MDESLPLLKQNIATLIGQVGHATLVKTAYECGIIFNQTKKTDNVENTPLNWSIANTNLTTALELLKLEIQNNNASGINLTCSYEDKTHKIKNQTPITLLICKGRSKTIPVLKQMLNFADISRINQIDSFGYTALDYAYIRRHYKAILMLEKAAENGILLNQSAT